MKLYNFLIKVILILLATNAALAARVGIFTGTFDPPHNSHKDTVERAIQYGDLDIVYVETGIPTHKPNALPYDVRIEMLRYVFKDIHEYTTAPKETRDLFKAKKYVKAITSLLEIHKNDIVFRIIGSDKFSSGTVKKLLNTDLQYIINPRDSSDLTNPDASVLLNRDQTILLPQATFGVSSTQIREDIKNGVQNPHLDEHIYEKILSLGAYQAPTCSSLL